MTGYNSQASGMRNHKNAALVLLVFLVVSGCSNGNKPGKESQAIIQVDDCVLTLAEFKEFFEAFGISPTEGRKEARVLQEARLRFLLQLVEEMIILRRAEELDVTVSPQELEEAVSRVEGDYTADGFKAAFVKQAISLETWKKRLKSQLIVEKVVRKELTENMTVTPEELREYYDKYPEKWTTGTGEQVRPYHILLSTEEEANRVLKRLNNGEDFATLARLFSIAPEAKQGGDMGYLARGDLPACLEDPVFALKKDLLSPVIKTPYGYHIFKIVGKRAAGQPVMDERIEKIRGYVREEKVEAAYGPWLAGLRSRYRITVNKDMISW
jgi:peptidyl-prolyl cis-trans isomerase C